MNTAIDNKLSRRLNKMIDSPVPVGIIANVGGYAVTTQRSFKGLSMDERQLIAPIYDDIRVDPYLTVAAVMMEGLWALIDISRGTLLTDFNYDDFKFFPENHSIVLIKDGKSGLFDVAQGKLLLDVVYEEISHSPGTRYLWTYSSLSGYEYFDYRTNVTIKLGHDIQECFDECHGHIFAVRDNRVHLLNSNGLSDYTAYRRLLAEIGGRITLFNSNRGVTAVADIYGNIL